MAKKLCEDLEKMSLGDVFIMSPKLEQYGFITEETAAKIKMHAKLKDQFLQAKKVFEWQGETANTNSNNPKLEVVETELRREKNSWYIIPKKGKTANTNSKNSKLEAVEENLAKLEKSWDLLKETIISELPFKQEN